MIWALVGLAAALIRLCAQRTNLVWLYLATRSLQPTSEPCSSSLSGWLNLLPGATFPISLETVSPATVVLILLAAIALMGLGFVGYAKRSISGKGKAQVDPGPYFRIDVQLELVGLDKNEIQDGDGNQPYDARHQARKCLEAICFRYLHVGELGHYPEVAVVA